jgi:hypothetical protein
MPAIALSPNDLRDAASCGRNMALHREANAPFFARIHAVGFAAVRPGQYKPARYGVQQKLSFQAARFDCGLMRGVAIVEAATRDG